MDFEHPTREGFIYGYFLPHRVAHINLWEFVAH